MQGFSLKNPKGRNFIPARAAGMIGHSSGRGKCATPKLYHKTKSWLSSDLCCINNQNNNHDHFYDDNHDNQTSTHLSPDSIHPVIPPCSSGD